VVTAPFAPGRLLVHRHFTARDLVFTPLTRVVSDDVRGLLLWMPHGTPVQREVTVDGRGPRAMPFDEWLAAPKKVVADVHRGPNILKLIPAADPVPVTHSVWWIFGPGAGFGAWYVNLESPSVRWDDGELAGIDTTDFDLDIWVSPDRTWR
jgi:hypothetical protein